MVGVIVKTATIKAEKNGGYPSSLIENGWYDETQNTSGKDSKLIINGGKFTDEKNYPIYTSSYNGYDMYKGVIMVNGGIFNTKNSSDADIQANKTATVIINDKDFVSEKKNNVDIYYTLKRKIENATVTGMEDLEYTGKELNKI